MAACAAALTTALRASSAGGAAAKIAPGLLFTGGQPLSYALGIHGNKYAICQTFCPLAVPNACRGHRGGGRRDTDWHRDVCVVSRAGFDQVANPGVSARYGLAGSPGVCSCSRTFVRAGILAVCISAGIQVVLVDIDCRACIFLTRQSTGLPPSCACAFLAGSLAAVQAFRYSGRAPATMAPIMSAVAAARVQPRWPWPVL